MYELFRVGANETVRNIRVSACRVPVKRGLVDGAGGGVGIGISFIIIISK